MAMDTSEIRTSDNVAKAAIGLNEIFKILPLQLSELVYDPKKQHELNNDLQNKYEKLSGYTIFFSEYRGKSYPQEKERNFVLDTEYSYSDIPCLPITPFIVKAVVKGESPFQDYLSFIRRSIEYLKSFNEKPIMGIVPDLGYGYLEELIKLYVEKNVNAFCIDLDCHTPVSHKPAILKCFRILKEYELLEKSLFYALNVNSGRFVKNKIVVNAKDVLSFGFGLDAMGRRHRVKYPSKETIKKLGPKWKPLDRKENKLRLFNKTDYGYYRAENANEIKNYPLDSSIPLKTFTQKFSVIDPFILHSQKIFNMEQLGLEAFTIRNIIEDEIPIEYLERKQYVDPKDIKQIKGFKESVVHPQTSLDEIL